MFINIYIHWKRTVSPQTYRESKAQEAPLLQKNEREPARAGENTTENRK